MIKYIRQGFWAIVLVVWSAVFANGATLSIPNTFVANTAAKAAEVNDNFGAVKTAVDDNDSRIGILESTLATLQSKVDGQAATISDQAAEIATLQSTVNGQSSTISIMQSQIAGINNSNVMELDPYLTVDTISDSRGPLVRFKGVNVQVVNGIGVTNVINGLGNLIIGYDTPRNGATYICSSGSYTDQTSCENAGYIWAVSLKGGSHYLIIGDQNNYTRYGGIVSGFRNTSTGAYASVSGGWFNTGRASYSSVSGGNGNTASGNYSNVSGGAANTASGINSNVSGGTANTASGSGANVSGGNGNTASGINSNVSAGTANTASGPGASVSGGNLNGASGSNSSISGGYGHGAPGTFNWSAGTYSSAQ